MYNTAKAVIFDGDDALLIKKEYEDGRIVFTLPGGSQNPGETMEETVKREVYEEVAATVKVIDLVQVYEHRQISKKDPELVKHKVEFAFYCQIEGPYTPVLGQHPDPHQTDVLWINKHKLSGLNLYPNELKNILLHDFSPGSFNYLGKVN